MKSLGMSATPSGRAGGSHLHRHNDDEYNAKMSIDLDMPGHVIVLDDDLFEREKWHLKVAEEGRAGHDGQVILALSGRASQALSESTRSKAEKVDGRD